MKGFVPRDLSKPPTQYKYSSFKGIKDTSDFDSVNFGISVHTLFVMSYLSQSGVFVSRLVVPPATKIYF